MSSPSSPSVHRIDRFRVPAEHRDEFLAIVAATHAVLRRQPGFLSDAILQQFDGTSDYPLMTWVVWADEASAGAAGAAVREAHAASGFDRAAFLTRTGIGADIGVYRRDATP